MYPFPLFNLKNIASSDLSWDRVAGTRLALLLSSTIELERVQEAAVWGHWPLGAQEFPDPWENRNLRTNPRLELSTMFLEPWHGTQVEKVPLNWRERVWNSGQLSHGDLQSVPESRKICRGEPEVSTGTPPCVVGPARLRLC